MYAPMILVYAVLMIWQKPVMREHLSSAKSPIGMQGPTIKTYFAKKMGIDPTKIVNVALTPCTAKKFEIRREAMLHTMYFDRSADLG